MAEYYIDKLYLKFYNRKTGISKLDKVVAILIGFLPFLITITMIIGNI